jgi:hypothetical protein
MTGSQQKAYALTQRKYSFKERNYFVNFMVLSFNLPAHAEHAMPASLPLNQVKGQVSRGSSIFQISQYFQSAVTVCCVE